MNTSIKTDDVIFNFFKQICDEKDDAKCLELGKNWIHAMETNLKSKSSAEWREYATQCMIEIMNHKGQQS